jgi:hypothetical protein
MESIISCSANPIIESPPTPTHHTSALAEITLNPIPIEVNMQKMVGVVFARLTAVEQTLKTRLDGFEKRLEALEAKCQRGN